MKRRDILKSSALVLGYAMVGGSAAAVLNGCKADTSPSWTPSFLTDEEVELLKAVTERIIPTTDTPGANAALVERYIDEALQNNFTLAEQHTFRDNIKQLDELAQEAHGSSFAVLSPTEMDAILQKLSDEADEKRSVEGAGKQVFDQVKQLTISGYFTSEIGVTQALIYDPLPGPYKGCIDFKDVGGTYA